MSSLEQELLALPELRRVTRERLAVLARALSEARIARDVAASLDGALAVEWLARRALAYERLRRLLPRSVDVLALIDSDGTPRTEPPLVTPPRVVPPRVTPPRVTPPRVTPPRAAPGTLAAVSSVLEREYARFSSAVAATTALVRECFLLNAGDTRATQLPERVLAARRAAVKEQMGALDKTRTAFLEAFAAAKTANDARGLDATTAIRAEDTARGAIGVLCKPDDGETFAREVAAASRCEPGEKTLPPAIAAFLRAEAPYEDYRDQRVYCYTGVETEDFPGDEDARALPPALRATVIPRAGAAIGPDGYVVVVKDGRYIGVAFPESREKRRRRALENTSFAEALTHAAMSAIASALSIALASARALVEALRSAAGVAVEALRSALDALLASAARWRAWLLATAIGVFGARRARELLGALANKGAFLAARAIGRSAVYFASPVIARAAFLSSLAALVYAYRQAPDDAERRSRALLVSAIAGLVSAYFAYPAANRQALAEPFARAPDATLSEYNATLKIPFTPLPGVAGGVEAMSGGGGGGGGGSEPIVAPPIVADVTAPLPIADTGRDVLLQGVPAVDDAELELAAPFPVDVDASELERSITSSSTALVRYEAFEQRVLGDTAAPAVYGPQADAATLERLARAYIDGALALADSTAAEPTLFSVFVEGAVEASHLQTLAVSAFFYVAATGLTGGLVPFLTTVAPLAIAKGGVFAGFTRAVGWVLGGNKLPLLLPDGNSTLIALGGRLSELEDVASVTQQTWAQSFAVSAAAAAQRVSRREMTAVREGVAWLARAGFDPNRLDVAHRIVLALLRRRDCLRTTFDDAWLAPLSTWLRRLRVCVLALEEPCALDARVRELLEALALAEPVVDEEQPTLACTDATFVATATAVLAACASERGDGDDVDDGVIASYDDDDNNAAAIGVDAANDDASSFSMSADVCEFNSMREDVDSDADGDGSGSSSSSSDGETSVSSSSSSSGNSSSSSSSRSDYSSARGSDDDGTTEERCDAACTPDACALVSAARAALFAALDADAPDAAARAVRRLYAAPCRRASVPSSRALIDLESVAALVALAILAGPRSVTRALALTHACAYVSRESAAAPAAATSAFWSALATAVPARAGLCVHDGHEDEASRVLSLYVPLADAEYLVLARTHAAEAVRACVPTEPLARVRLVHSAVAAGALAAHYFGVPPALALAALLEACPEPMLVAVARTPALYSATPSVAELLARVSTRGVRGLCDYACRVVDE